jgi:Cof subfamily protein (haloacid dehalogenase superfamily)
MNFKALAIDLDGTLLTGDELPTENIRAVRAARDQGLRIIIATARWSHYALRVAKALDIEGPVIACSGAQVHDAALGRDIFDERIPLRCVEALYSICNAERCIATITVDQRVLLKLEGDPAAELDAEFQPVRSLVADSRDLPRVAAIQGTRCNQRIRSELEDAFRDSVNVFDSIGPTGKLVLTLTGKLASKGLALEAACRHLGIETGQVVAFGDAENDVEMFRRAGASVAMGQADEKTKSAATWVSLSNDQAGVAHAIDRLLTRGGF